MTDLEIEVKFYMPDLASVTARALEIGAVSQGKFFETNLRFEDPNQSLSAQGSLLRLRRDSKNRLTFKSKPRQTGQDDDEQFKIFRELEVEVSDFDIMKQILASLGYRAEQTYEKWRETFWMDGVHICMDTLPFGDFLEIEGEKEAIRSIAHRLGLEWERRILENYLGIFESIRRKTNAGFKNVTFSNFKNIHEDLSDHIRQFEIGR